MVGAWREGFRVSYDNASPSAILTRSAGLGHTLMFWTKVLSYPNTFWTTFFGSANGDDCFIGSDDSVLPATDLGFITSSGTQIVASGSSTAWNFVCLIADDTVAFNYQVFWRAEHATSISSGNLGFASASGFANFFLMNNPPTSNNIHCRMSAYKEWTNYNSLGTGSTLLTNILAESAQNTPLITAGNCNYLSCALGSTVGQDTSPSAHNWGLSGGSITTNADEPIMSLGANPANALFFGACR